MENFTPYSEAVVAALPLTLLVMAVTQKLKALIPNFNAELFSIILGGVFGLMSVLYFSGVPTTMPEVIAALLYAIGAAFMPSGAYEVVNPKE